MKKNIFIFLAVIVASACASREKPGREEQQVAEEKPVKQVSVSDLLGKEWSLQELNEAPIVLDPNFPKKPVLVFEKDDNLSGNLGCNGFGGVYKIKEDGTIAISNILSTQMACANLEVEQAFTEVLQGAKAFEVENGLLTLKDENQKVTAKLTAQ